MINIYTTEIYQERIKTQRQHFLTHLDDSIGNFLKRVCQIIEK